MLIVARGEMSAIRSTSSFDNSRLVRFTISLHPMFLLGTFVAIVERLDALVSNDSAPMHVATAVGVPVVAVFCATTPAQGFGPYGTRAALVEADLECRPCGRHGGRRCPRGTEDCMRLVGAADVLKALRSLGSSSRASASP